MAFSCIVIFLFSAPTYTFPPPILLQPHSPFSIASIPFSTFISCVLLSLNRYCLSCYPPTSTMPPLLAFCLPQTLFEMFNTLTENLLSTVSIYATSGNNELFGLRPSILSSVYSLCSSWNLKEKIPSV